MSCGCPIQLCTTTHFCLKLIVKNEGKIASLIEFLISYLEIKGQLDAADVFFLQKFIFCSTCFDTIMPIIRNSDGCCLWYLMFGFQVVGLVWSCGLFIRFAGCSRWSFIAKIYFLLNMFRTLLCPSSGAQECYTDGCCRWYLVLWLSSFQSGVELWVVCPTT